MGKHPWRRELAALGLGLVLNGALLAGVVVSSIELRAGNDESAGETGSPSGRMGGARTPAGRRTAEASSTAAWQRMVDADESCLPCHDLSPGLSHPTGVSAADRQSGLPLDSQGRMRCQTCHLSANDREQHRGPPENPALLRRASALALCMACHRRDSHGDRRSVHGAWLGRAHLGIAEASRRGYLDAETSLCLSCHDGAIQRPCEAQSLRGDGPAIGMSHPLGQRYDRPKREGSRLRPIGSLAPAIRLFDGRLGCGSCHNPYARGAKLLCIDNRGSRLCRSCHAI